MAAQLQSDRFNPEKPSVPDRSIDRNLHPVWEEDSLDDDRCRDCTDLELSDDESFAVWRRWRFA
ncbi:MAG: hypothetical protein J7641_22100 [Cyanobacteria bacterium SID2]|nr:hypothetical protein [Cyanobacteria bacterium SID2]MBP0004526.1 hypothetical protein [Cyanobacteria bacterium SBC]